MLLTDDDGLHRSWKVKQAAEIAKREEEAAMKKDETVVKARLAIDKFYQDYNGKKEKNISKNKLVPLSFNAEDVGDDDGMAWDEGYANWPSVSAFVYPPSPTHIPRLRSPLLTALHLPPLPSPQQGRGIRLQTNPPRLPFPRHHMGPNL